MITCGMHALDKVSCVSRFLFNSLRMPLTYTCRKSDVLFRLKNKCFGQQCAAF